jgi:signal transduction histidine kinase
MKDIFFDPTYHNSVQTTINIAAFLLLSGILIYIIYLILSRLLYQKWEQRKEFGIRLSFLWAVIVYFVFFNLYIGLLVYFTGPELINPLSFNFYLGILAQIVIYLAVIILFFISRKSLNQTLKNTSLR